MRMFMHIYFIILVSLCGLNVSSVIEDRQREIREAINGIEANLTRIGSDIESLKTAASVATYKIRKLKNGPTFCRCQWTGYLNGYDISIRYFVPNRKVLTGFYSHHDDWYQDREWKVQICDVCY